MLFSEGCAFLICGGGQLATDVDVASITTCGQVPKLLNVTSETCGCMAGPLNLAPPWQGCISGATPPVLTSLSSPVTAKRPCITCLVSNLSAAKRAQDSGFAGKRSMG